MAKKARRKEAEEDSYQGGNDTLSVDHTIGANSLTSHSQDDDWAAGESVGC
jgi:hypothetical protein